MRLMCVLSGHRFEIIKESWKPKDDLGFETHVQFLRCKHCLDTRAVATSPVDSRSMWSHPNRANETMLIVDLAAEAQQ